MKKGEKILISVLIGIAVVNWYLQYKASVKIEELDFENRMYQAEFVGNEIDALTKAMELILGISRNML